MISPTIQAETTDKGNQGNGRWMVVIYNNDTTSVDEVIEILMISTGCDVHEAYCETWEAHTFGKASVHFADQSECERIASLIETVGVDTAVCLEWDP